MVDVLLHPCAVLELAVMTFQACGFVALCLFRLLPSARWAGRARVAFLLALIGLGITGALCSQFDSKFALFAGATMTIFLIGLSGGTATVEPIGNRHYGLGANLSAAA